VHDIIQGKWSILGKMEMGAGLENGMENIL